MKREAGFTLIEMLVALSLTSMIAMAGATLLTNTLKASDRLNDVTSSTLDADIAHTLMRDDFANVAADPVTFSGNRSGRDSVLVALKRRGIGLSEGGRVRADMLQVEYRFSDGLFLRRVWKETGSSAPRAEYSERILASGVNDLRVTYYDGRDWLQEWQPGAEELPLAIAVRLGFGDSDTLTQYFMVGGGG